MWNGARSSSSLWSCLTRWLFIGVTLLLVGGLPRLAAAESEETEELLQKGIELRRSGRDSEALEIFLQAEERDPRSVRVMLHVATAAQAAGKWVMADSYMKKVSRYSNDPYYRRYRDSIAQVEQAIAQRVGRFIVAGGPPGAVVTVDGRRVGTLPMDSEIPLEAGTYSVEVSKDGFYPLTRSVTVSGGSLSREVVNLNELPEEERLALASGTASFDSRDWYEKPWLTWTFAGLGVAAAATAGAAYAIREDRASVWNDDSECLSLEFPNRAREDECRGVRSDIDTAEAVTTISLAAAGTFAIVAVAHWFSLPDNGKSAEPSDGSASLRCGAGFGTLSCAGTF